MLSTQDRSGRVFILAALIAASGSLALADAPGWAKGKKPGKAAAAGDAKGKALLERLSALVADHAAGYEAVGEATIAHLEKKGTKELELALDAGYCYRVLATGEKDAFEIGVEARLDGKAAASTSGTRPAALVDVCAPQGGSLALDFGTPSFGGDFITATYRTKVVKVPPKDDVGARLAVLSDKHAPGGKVVHAPAIGIVGEGEGVDIDFGVKGGSCYKVVAVGGNGISDVDVVVRAGSGGKAAVLAEDGTADDHPVVTACAPQGVGTVGATATPGKGSGALAVAAWEVKQVSIAGVSEGQKALEERLAGEAAVYAQDMNMVGMPEGGDILNKKPVVLEAGLAKGVCYKFIAVGGSGITDLDIAVTKGKAKGKAGVLAKDTTDDDAPIASLCAAETMTATVTLSSKGTGSYAYGLFAGASKAAGAAGAFDDLTAAIDAAAVEKATGWEAAGAMKTAVVGGGGVATFDVPMDGDYCYGLLAVALGDIGDIDVEASAGGLALAADKDDSPAAMVEVCPGGDVVASVKLGAGSGTGPVALKPFRKENEVDAVYVPVGGVGTSYIAKAIRKLHEKSGQSRPAVGDFLEGSLETSKTQTFDVPLSGGKCYTVLAVGVPSVKSLEVKLVSPLGDEVASGSGSSTGAGAQVAFDTTPCPKWNGTYKLTVKMFSGYGSFGAQIFGK